MTLPNNTKPYAYIGMSGVILRGYLTDVGEKQLRFTIVGVDDPRRTAFKLSGLKTLYAGQSPVSGDDFFVNNCPHALVFDQNKIVDPSALMGSLVDVWAVVRQYKYFDEITKVGWCLDLKKMECDYAAAERKLDL